MTACRHACKLRVRDLIMRDAGALAACECTNTGIPLIQLRKLHFPGGAHHFQFYAELASQLKGELHQQRSGYQIQVSREPVGVAALISPWNGPVNMSCAKIAAALAFGNCCVLKPSEYTPLALVRLMEILREAGVPDGVVNIAAARNLKRTTMEPGGKSANIILDSADLERALCAALAAIFTTNGQQCLAGSRFQVRRSIARDCMARFGAQVGRDTEWSGYCQSDRSGVTKTHSTQ